MTSQSELGTWLSMLIRTGIRLCSGGGDSWWARGASLCLARYSGAVATALSRRALASFEHDT